MIHFTVFATIFTIESCWGLNWWRINLKKYIPVNSYCLFYCKCFSFDKIGDLTFILVILDSFYWAWSLTLILPCISIWIIYNFFSKIGTKVYGSFVYHSVSASWLEIICAIPSTCIYYFDLYDGILVRNYHSQSFFFCLFSIFVENSFFLLVSGIYLIFICFGFWYLFL